MNGGTPDTAGIQRGAIPVWLPPLFAFLFFCKAVILAFWVTPLWSIPDEIGHFNYAQNLAMGKGLPVLGVSRVDIDFQTGFKRPPRENASMLHIAQHPPVFYLLAAGAWKVSTWLTDDPRQMFRAPRVVAAATGAGALLALYYLALLLTRRPDTSLGLMACVSFLPMYSYIASGTNHDTTVTLFASLAILYWSRFLLRANARDAYWCALWLSFACATKMTALVLAVPMVVIMLLELTGHWRQWLGKALAICALALVLPGAWMARNAVTYGNPLMTAPDLPGRYRLADSPLTDSFLGYLSGQPAIEGYFNHFFGLFGLRAGGAALQVSGDAYVFYAVLCLLLLLMAMAWLVTRSFAARPVRRPARALIDWMHALARVAYLDKAVRLAMPLLMAVVAVAAFEWILAVPDAWPRRSVYAALAALCAWSLMVFVQPLPRRQRLAAYSLVVFAFFFLVLLWKVYGIYLLDGRLRAIHGRYLFPLLGLLLAGVVVPAMALLRWRPAPVILLAILLALVEMHVYFWQVLPFYKGGGA